MGRWRPPPPKSSPYLTRSGFETLQAEEKELWDKRRVVVKALSAAAAEGDRSENAEYIYRKKELAGLDRRIRYLQKRLPNLKVVEESTVAATNNDKVVFGCWITLEKDDGENDPEEVTYRIVGPDETDASAGYISMDSPLAKALLKKSPDDEVSIMLKDNKVDYVIVDIRYS
ncbi:MAG: GreA/GreB family elongation factor [Gammaproteobacteria bacterium]